MHFKVPFNLTRKEGKYLFSLWGVLGELTCDAQMSARYAIFL